MYKSNIITQAWVYLMITLAKQRAFMGKRDMIYNRPSETVPEKFFGSYVVVFLQLHGSNTYSGISIHSHLLNTNINPLAHFFFTTVSIHCSCSNFASQLTGDF